MARILFIHNTFPGRFEFLLPALKAAGHEMAAISQGGRAVDGVRHLQWRPGRGGTPGIFDLAVRAEVDLLRGRAAADSALQLRQEGFEPDLIIGHPAWGETVFMKEIFPRARQILVGEFYYRATGGDVGFDPEFEKSALEDGFKVHAKNAAMAMAYAEADRIICPTPFQASVFPAAFQDRIAIIHEGIDTDRVRALAGAKLRIDGKTILDGTTPVVTFVNRTFEPLRGFHIMMRALPRLLRMVPNARVLMIGGDDVRGYGIAAPGGATWRAHMVKEVGKELDPARVFFTDRVPYDTLLSALSLSWAHIYYTYPFVLSWSLLEAMACGCLILGSDTAPVRDVIRHRRNGILTDFFDVDGLANAMIDACREPSRYRVMREKAREDVVAHFDQQRICVPAWMREIAPLLPR